MSNFKKAIAILLIVVAIVASITGVSFINSKTSEQDNYNLAITQARTEIWKDINSGRASSGTVAIMDNGRIVYSEGFAMADRETSIPVDGNTLFNIGSISKTFCATAVMLLVDEGKVNLDDNVTKYLPDFTMADSRYTDITVRMLLDHTCGLSGTTWSNNIGYEYNPTIYEDFLASISQAHLRSAPGEMAPYTNDGFTLAEMLVARVSGMSYMDFLSQKIFKPLALDHTGISVGEQSDKTVAAYYQPATGKSVPSEVLSMYGAGGLSSTAEDLVRFADSFSAGGKHILSQSSITEITKTHLSPFAVNFQDKTGINPEFYYGLGLDIAGLPYYMINGINVIGKGGDTYFYHSQFLSAPDQRISVAVIEAGIGSRAEDIANDLFNTVLQQKGLIEKEDTPISAPATPESIPAQYASFQGYYSLHYCISVDFDANICYLGVFDSGSGVWQSVPLYYCDNYFYTETGVRFYLVSVDEQDYLLASICNNRLYVVYGQRIREVDNPLTLSIDINGEQWLRRNVQPFEALTYAPSHMVVSKTLDELPGYVVFSGIKQINSPSYAGIPSDAYAVREQTELTLTNKDGQVWAQVSDSLYSPASVAPLLKNGVNTVTIGNKGYSEWFRISNDVILSFQKSTQGRIIVFSPVGMPIYDSMMDTGDVYVPGGGLIEVAGAAGDVFNVTAK
jgi:CubicO group peptidase (beta-lactamase class C family)